MYNFLTGPALWATFIIFGAGLLLRIFRLYRLSRKKDQVIYNHDFRGRPEAFEGEIKEYEIVAGQGIYFGRGMMHRM